ncbi:hypothetical protein Tco_0925716 [Tanacetum coccineum]|uniref:Uncharacterized protein n=1 Tax=Tanacetum coccineum TaxID=301880 RepID=A0ABQ5DA93_9ASTR
MEYQLAEIFTKALCKERIEFFINKLGMRSFTPETLKQLNWELLPETYWELLPKEILGAITQRDTGSYYPKRYWELLPKEILGATTQRDTGSYYPKRYWDVLWENGGNLGNNISG